MKKVTLFTFIAITLGFYSCQSEASPEIESPIVESKTTSIVEQSLYHRLGGSEGISSIVDELISTHLKNPIVSEQFIYLNESPETMEMVKKTHARFFRNGYRRNGKIFRNGCSNCT
jgi:hypothetical protein